MCIRDRSRGPLVYCMESVDNPGVSVPGAVLDTGSPLVTRWSPGLCGGACLIEGKDPSGRDLVFIPYYAWANRGPSSMEVWVRSR